MGGPRSAPYREGYYMGGPHIEKATIWVVHDLPHIEKASMWVVHDLPHIE